MLAAIKKALPAPVKKQARNTIKLVKYGYRRHKIQGPISRDEPIKIIVGAAETWQAGWYSTNEQWLDITRRADWDSVFKGKQLITHIVAEHVFEHLTHEEAQETLRCMYDYLMPGGRVRIAVPDGYNPDPVYLKHVGICGIGDDAADHKQLLNADVLMKLFEDAGFDATHVEGFTKDGAVVQESYSTKDGFITRSRSNPDVAKMPWDFPDAGTSLIVDGVKPLQ